MFRSCCLLVAQNKDEDDEVTTSRVTAKYFVSTKYHNSSVECAKLLPLAAAFTPTSAALSHSNLVFP